MKGEELMDTVRDKAWLKWREEFDKICQEEILIDLDSLPDTNYPRSYFDSGLTPEEGWQAFQEDWLQEEMDSTLGAMYDLED